MVMQVRRVPSTERRRPTVIPPTMRKRFVAYISVSHEFVGQASHGETSQSSLSSLRSFRLTVVRSLGVKGLLVRGAPSAPQGPMSRCVLAVSSPHDRGAQVTSEMPPGSHLPIRMFTHYHQMTRSGFWERNNWKTSNSTPSNYPAKSPKFSVLAVKRKPMW